MKHKHFFLLLPFVFALILLAGFLVVLFPKPSLAATTESVYEYEPVTITYWNHNTGTREAYIHQLIEEFNATNPYSITVVGEYAGGYNDIFDKVIDGIRNDGDLPNVVVAYPGSFADFARYGRVRFLDDYIDDPEIGIQETADFYPDVLDYYRLGEYGN